MIVRADLKARHRDAPAQTVSPGFTFRPVRGGHPRKRVVGASGSHRPVVLSQGLLGISTNACSSIGQEPKNIERPSLDPGPVARGDDWLRWVNEPQTEAELLAMRQSISRGRPFGSKSWQAETASKLGLESTLRPRGRPWKNQTK
jgi:hypothetical protein